MRPTAVILLSALVLSAAAALLFAQDDASKDTTTLKVEVNLVNILFNVRDKKSGLVGNLNKDDFKVFEDGVEQKITAFSVERSGLEQAGIPAKREPLPAAPVNSSTVIPHAPVRRTYMICIDTLHASFNNFVAAREALAKLFQQEHSEDSQYVVVALGVSAQMVVNVTRDPSAVLAVFQSCQWCGTLRPPRGKEATRESLSEK